MATLLISSISYADNPLQSQGRIEYGEGASKVIFDAADLSALESRIADIEAAVNGSGGSESLQNQIDAVANNLTNYKADVSNTYATQTWVNNKNYATQSWVTGKGYLTSHQSLTGYATTSWVTSNFEKKGSGSSSGSGGYTITLKFTEYDSSSDSSCGVYCYVGNKKVSSGWSGKVTETTLIRFVAQEPGGGYSVQGLDGYVSASQYINTTVPSGSGTGSIELYWIVPWSSGADSCRLKTTGSCSSWNFVAG